MKIKGTGSPLSSGAEPLEPLDPRELRQAVNSGRFADALAGLDAKDGAGQASATRAALSEIAASADLTTNEGAQSAVRESARYMIGSRLDDEYRGSEQGAELIENLSEYVAGDPLLKAKLTTILRRLQNN